jgi:predicted secreted protein
MAAINGTLYSVFATVGTISTASASTDRLYACKTASLKVNVDIPDASTKESGGWWEGIAGQKDWSIDFGGVWNEAGSATAMTATEIMADIIAGSVVKKFAFVPAALGTTIPGWKGMGHFSGETITADMEKPCEFSGTVKGTGALVLFDS